MQWRICTVLIIDFFHSSDVHEFEDVFDVHGFEDVFDVHLKNWNQSPGIIKCF